MMIIVVVDNIRIAMIMAILAITTMMVTIDSRQPE
jgi:hypothetical protein